MSIKVFFKDPPQAIAEIAGACRNVTIYFEGLSAFFEWADGSEYGHGPCNFQSAFDAVAQSGGIPVPAPVPAKVRKAWSDSADYCAMYAGW
jgi:hypothetical protein